jgi:site-specific recombinase XerC
MSILRHNKDVVNEEEIYFNFINSIKSEVTKKNYERNVNSFMQFCKVTKLSELLVITDPQKQIINYIISLRKRELAFNSLSLSLNAIYHFYEMNDVPLNKKKINMFK